MKTGKEIVEQYRHLFYQEEGGGFSCGPGWNMLIELMLKMIDRHIKNKSKINEKQPDGTYTYTIDNSKFADFKITTIKEKFGVLSIYCTGADDAIQAIIVFAESASQLFCEHCGINHNLGKTTGWIRVLCHDCFLIQREKTNTGNWRSFEELQEYNMNTKNFFEI